MTDIETNTRRPAPLTLTPLQARVLAVLVEKERTVPDTYPLTVNALLAGCNQKSSRDPVMDASESEVIEALDALRRLSLVIESSGARTMRYAHNFKRVLGVPGESVALLATLMLRGPQTAAELRAHAERLHRLSDLSATEAFLTELATWPSGALAVELPRQPGSREHRWMHRLCGEPLDATPAASAPVTEHDGDDGPGAPMRVLLDELADTRAELTALRERVAALEDALRALRGA